MGNCLQRKIGWQLDTQETHWNLRLQNGKQRTYSYFRCWSGCHIVEGCSCLPCWVPSPDTVTENQSRNQPPECGDNQESSLLGGSIFSHWKNISTFKARQESPKQNEGMTSAPMQDNANQIYTEELCYILVDHKALGGRPSGSSTERFYENVSSKAERRRESSRGTETEYSVLRFPSTPQSPPPAEGEYELLVPSRLSFHARQQPRPHTAPFETHFSHLQ